MGVCRRPDWLLPHVSLTVTGIKIVQMARGTPTSLLLTELAPPLIP